MAMKMQKHIPNPKLKSSNGKLFDHVHAIGSEISRWEAEPEPI